MLNDLKDYLIKYTYHTTNKKPHECGA